MTDSPSGPYSADPDDVLVGKSKEGDGRAFDELINRYSRKLYGMVYNMTSNREDARDILQVAFSRAYQSIHRFEGKSSFYTWMNSIAHNTTLNHLKSRKRKASLSYDDVDSGIQNDPAFVDISHHSNPQRSMNVKEIQEKLNVALQKLSVQHRAVVVMNDIQDLPQPEIAKILGISEGTVRSRLFYAHQHLQSLLSEFYQK